MKKFFSIVITLIVIAAILGGLYFYVTGTPEFALFMIQQDIYDSGMDGLTPHLTGSAKQSIDTISAVTESDLVSAIMGVFKQDDYLRVLKSEIQKVEWHFMDIIKAKDSAQVILRFNYNFKLQGTIQISMVKEADGWKISGFEAPEFTSINL